MIDYQWPANLHLPDRFISGNRKTFHNDRLTDEIETFFEQFFKVPAILLPSGRAAISLILQHHGIKRTQHVYAPDYSSHCVWESITRFGNPRTVFSKDCSVALVVHKFARTHMLSAGKSYIIIEDSVDSLFTDPSVLFPNNGAYEILSLPKIIGSFSGGILFIKNANNAKQIRKSLKKDPALSVHQSRLKYLAASRQIQKKNLFYDWESLEWKNHFLDYNGLKNILDTLENYRKNAEVTEHRMAVLKSDPLLSPYLTFSRGKLPPVASIPKKYFKRDTGLLMERYLNIGLSCERPVYEPAYLIPMHFGINDTLFHTLHKEARKHITT